MNHKQFRRARLCLGLNQAQMGAMLGITWQQVSRYEMDPETPTSRAVSPMAARLMRAYVEGYRPCDWPIEEERPKPIRVRPKKSA